MKKLVCLMLTLVMALSLVSVAGAQESEIPEKVEISFKVGDSTLMINGTPVTVETPYIAGAGTTLVPLRVITEAFGAKVTWVNETKEIILEYPDVNITLQIGNINATVNNHTETLPEAPVLSPNGVTMVPLRFISETFGATVGYDNETAAITVVKEANGDSDTITSSTDLPRIGDSYWGWSMLNPAGMMMTERNGDGTSTCFTDEEGEIWVDIYDFSKSEQNEDGIFKSVYDIAKSDYFAGLTLSKDEKSKDSFGNRTFRITGRDKEIYVDNYVICVGKMTFEFYFSAPTGSEKIAQYTSVLESFKKEFAANDDEKSQTYDLSNVDENGNRTIENEDLKLSFKVPAEFSEQSLSLLNLIMYTGEDDEEVTFGIYTITDTVKAKDEAEEDRAMHVKYFNAKFCDISEVMEYEGIEGAYYYTMKTSGLTNGDYDFYDVFFEKGDYLYNVTITSTKDDGALFNTVLGSLKTEELDSETVGTFLRDNGTDGETDTINIGDWTLTYGDLWFEYGSNDMIGILMNASNENVALQIIIVDEDNVQASSAKELVNASVIELKKKGVEIIEPVKAKKIGNYSAYTVAAKSVNEETGDVVYARSYVLKAKGTYCIFDINTGEEQYNTEIETEVLKMIESLTNE